MSKALDELDSLEEDVWAIWSRAAANGAQAPGALATLATTRLGGGSSARMIVLRGADPDAAALTFWTNRTSRKVEELTQEPRAALSFWLPEEQLQIRVIATITVADGSSEAWETLSMNGRLNYLALTEPDSQLSSPLDNSAEPDIKQFAIMKATVEQIDALSLAHRPHRRAICDNEGVRWVAP